MSVTLEARRLIRERCAYLETNRNRLVIDGDTHPSDPRNYPEAVKRRLKTDPNYFHTRPISGPDLLYAMDRNGIDMALSWQNPAMTVYPGDEEGNFAALKQANAYIKGLAERYPERIIPSGWTDPKALGVEGARAMARLCVEEWGFPVVKLNPAQNEYRIDSPDVLRVVDQIVELGAVPAFHFGGDTIYTPADGLETLAKRYGGHPVIGVHMGGGGGDFAKGEDLYQKARALGLRRTNVFFIISAKRDAHIESDLISYCAAGQPFCRNLAVGSDAPYCLQSWSFGALRALFADLGRGEAHGDRRLAEEPALFDAQAIQNFMGRNLADLIVSSYHSILACAQEGPCETPLSSSASG